MTMELKTVHKAFPKESNCIILLEKVLWNNGPRCPYCKTSFYTALKNEDRYHCNKCNNTFSVMVGTVFHKTKCDLRKWFFAIYIYQYSEIPITARALADLISVTKDTAWLMLSKIKKANVDSSELFDKIREVIKKV